MDGLGNRTGSQTLSDNTVSFTVESLTNRYTAIGGNSISHDDAGNLTVDKDGYKYFYDYENRVVKIEKPDGLGGWDDVAEVAYDALGRRIRVINSVASETTLYYYNPEWQCLAEYSGAGALQAYYVYGNYIDEPLVMHRQSDGKDYFYGHDHLYSTGVLLDDTGSVVERCEYDAYGTVHIMDASYNPRSVSAYGNPYTFTGRRLDVLDTGNLLRMQYRFRDYDLYAGRFLQHDPLGYVDDSNLYSLARSCPVIFVDPLGLLSEVGDIYAGMWSFDLYERDFFNGSDHLAEYWVQIMVACATTANGGYVPTVLSGYEPGGSFPKYDGQVDSMGWPYGTIDNVHSEVRASTFYWGVPPKLILLIEYRGAALEGSKAWPGIVGWIGGGVAGEVLFGPVGAVLGQLIGAFAGANAGNEFGGGFVVRGKFARACDGKMDVGIVEGATTFGDDELFWVGGNAVPWPTPVGEAPPHSVIPPNPPVGNVPGIIGN